MIFIQNKWRSRPHLVVVADEDVDGRQEELEHRLLVALFHLEAQTLQEAGRTFGTLAAAVLQAKKKEGEKKRKTQADSCIKLFS